VTAVPQCLEQIRHNIKYKVKVILRLTVNEPVCVGVRHPSGSQEQIFISIRQSQICWCWAPSLTRGRVCRLKLLLALPLLTGNIRSFSQYFQANFRTGPCRREQETIPPNSAPIITHTVTKFDSPFTAINQSLV
jgi:hypothetical protein